MGRFILPGYGESVTLPDGYGCVDDMSRALLIVLLSVAACSQALGAAVDVDPNQPTTEGAARSEFSIDIPSPHGGAAALAGHVAENHSLCLRVVYANYLYILYSSNHAEARVTRGTCAANGPPVTVKSIQLSWRYGGEPVATRSCENSDGCSLTEQSYGIAKSISCAAAKVTAKVDVGNGQEVSAPFVAGMATTTNMVDCP